MREFPRYQPKIITDNEEALDIIMGLGVFEHVSEKLPLGRCVLFHTLHGHHTHWILIGRFHGFENEEDNGYMVGIWPKAFYSASVLDKHIAGYTDSQPIIRTLELPAAKPVRN